MFAVVFPGQGSQAVGMAGDFAKEFAESRAVLEEADAALAAPLSTWIAEGPSERLAQTEVTQPAILAASIAIYRALAARLPAAPALFAGHSLGEYTALVAAGGLPLGEAVALVRERGRFMQEAVPLGQGDMAAVMGLEGDEVARVCQGIDGVVSPSNFNSPGQTVIAGEKAAVARASEALRAAGAKRVVALDVSAPFHCELMRPAMERLTPLLADASFAPTSAPIVSNVTAAAYAGGDDARKLLREQVCAPVRWVDCVRALCSAGVRLQLEVGPGKVLSGFAGRIDRDLARANVAATSDLAAALDAIASAVE